MSDACCLPTTLLVQAMRGHKYTTMTKASTRKTLLFLAALSLGISFEASARLNARPTILDRTILDSGAGLFSTHRISQESRRDRKKDETTDSSLSSDKSMISCSAANNGCDCPERMYCHTANDSCNRTAQGVCERIRAACTREYWPVCGCDGVTTYANPCVARWSQASNGMQVGIKYQGKCREKVF